MSDMNNEERRRQGRQRSEAYRDRRRHGRVLVSVEVSTSQLAALERLALLEVGERDRTSVGWAISRFLDAAAHVSSLGDALWPAGAYEATRASPKAGV